MTDLTIAGIAAGSPDFDILTAALDATGLIPAVDAADADLTVFAPTDSAFTQLAADFGFTGDTSDEAAVTDFLVTTIAAVEMEDPAVSLSNVLLYHVSPGAKTLTEVAALETVDTLLEGATVAPEGLTLADNEPDLINPTLIATDIVAANGIVHAIDRVLLPVDLPGNDAPTITEIVLASGEGFDENGADFDLLREAVVLADLADTLDADDADLTVFAPNDDAFVQLARDLGFTGTGEADALDFLATTLSDLGGGDPITPLTQILTYHVSPGGKQLGEIVLLESVDTLEGTPVGVDGPVLVDREPDIINPALITTDIQAGNGVVHVIDRVLLPLDLEGNAVPTITGTVAASGDGPDGDNTDFDILNAALALADLDGALDMPSADLTVFAPTDSAFINLANAFGFTGNDEAGALDAIVNTLTAIGGGDPVPFLTEILLYHVSPDAKQLAQIAPLASVDTLQGGTIGIDGTTLVDQDTDFVDPQLVATDIQASNGIIHAIDNVLIPIDVPASNGDNEVLVLFGTPGNDDLRGASDNDFLSGEEGSDRLRGRNGDDVLDGGDGNDDLRGQRGDDTLLGGDGEDRLRAHNGDDFLNGGAGADLIQAGRGDDVLDGGTGQDLYIGGRGADVFVLTADGATDFIFDFNARQGDVIDLTGHGVTSYEAFAAATTQEGRDLLHTDAVTGEITVFERTSIDDLTESDFIFA